MRHRLLLGVSIFLLSAGTAIAGMFDEGAAAFDGGQHEVALGHWAPLAEQGHMDAQFNLGIMYDQGIGVPEDSAAAAQWFEQAAAQGDPIAAFNLGLMYTEGRGVDQDFSQAARWYALAAEHEHPEAMERLSYLYAHGRGVDQDLGLAVRLSERAHEAECLLGEPEQNHAARLTAFAHAM
jgi:uncharacterized protein